MILGGGSCQKNAFIKAAKAGLYTVLVDYYEDPVCRSLAGAHARVSTFDADACVRAAREYQADAVVTVGTDQPVLTAAKVAAELNLPSPIDEATALRVTNKRVMKRTLAENGIPTCRYALITEDNYREKAAKLRPPYVLKPVDSQGQRGVVRIGADEIAENFTGSRSFSREDALLLEEFYPSDEISVSGWVSGGEVFVLTVTDRLHLDAGKHIGICRAHTYPSGYIQPGGGRVEEISDICRRIVSAFGIKNGPLYVQLLAGDDGILVNELSCRVGGAFEDVFIPYVTGFDILQAAIDISLGEKVDVSVLKNRAPSDICVSVQLFFASEGRVSWLTPAEVMSALPGVLDFGYNYSIGEIIPKTENAAARFGYAVIAARDKGELALRLRKFNRTLAILNENGENLFKRDIL